MARIVFRLFETGCAKWIKLDGKHNQFHSSKENATIIESPPGGHTDQDWVDIFVNNNLTWLFKSGTIKIIPDLED